MKSLFGVLSISMCFFISACTHNCPDSMGLTEDCTAKSAVSDINNSINNANSEAVRAQVITTGNANAM